VRPERGCEHRPDLSRSADSRHSFLALSAFAPLLVFGVLAITACSNREHSNLFDPENPATGGRPVSFAAVAGNSLVTLRWQSVAGLGLSGYQLFRRAESESAFQAISTVLSSTTELFFDLGVVNGTTYHYRLFYVFEDGLAASPAEDLAIPGPLRPWVTDLSARALLQLTPDGRHVAFRDLRFDGPTFVGVDPSNGTVWTADTFHGDVITYNPATGFRIANSDLGRPTSLAVDAASHTAWVCDEFQNLVGHFEPSGDRAQPPQIGPFGLPIAVAIDPNDGSVWVCENSAEFLRLYSSAGLLRWSLAVPRPSRVAVDSLTREGWVTSFERRQVVRVATTGVARDTVVGFAGPIGVAVDSRRGRIWVADAVAGQVVALDRDGTVEFRVGGLPEVREVAVDEATGNAWVTVPGAGAVAIVSSAGALVHKLEGLERPYGIALDPGVR
jgi:hypothetical protein